jgi:putative transposase
MHDFLLDAAPPVFTKLVAQRDISFSNSPVEAINKIFKRFLKYSQPQNFEEFQVCVERFVKEYAFMRPHGSLEGLTPFEAYTLKTLPALPQEAIDGARQARIEANKRLACIKCG